MKETTIDRFDSSIYDWRWAIRIQMDLSFFFWNIHATSTFTRNWQWATTCNHWDSIHDWIGVRRKEDNSVFLSSLHAFHFASFFPFCTWMKAEVSITNTSMHFRTLMCLRRHINKGNNRAIVLCFGHFVDFSLLNNNICHSLFHHLQPI